MTFPAVDGDLTFAFDEDRVEGIDPDGHPLRLALSDLTRFDIDSVTREGDDKTHYYYYILLETGTGRLIYYDREPDYVYNPIPGLTRKDIAELNLGALAWLADLDLLRTPFGKVEPWRAVRKEGETGPPRSPPQQARGGEPAPPIAWAVFAVMLYALWLLWRLLFPPER